MGINQSVNNRIARNSIFMTIRMAIVLVITLFTTRFVLRSLGVDDYGVYNVVCGFVAMFAFLNTSVSNGIQRFYNYELGQNDTERCSTVFMSAVYIQVIVALIVILFTETVGLWYLYSKLVLPPFRETAAFWVFQFSIASFVIIIMQAPYSAAIMAHERMDFFAFVGVLDAVLKLVIAIAISYAPYDKLITYGLLLFIVSVLDLLLYVIYAKRHFPEVRMHRIKDYSLFKPMLSFSGWNIFGSISNVVKEEGLNLVLNFFYGTVVNAARGVASQVSAGVQSFVQSLSVSVRPQVIQSYAQGNIDRTYQLTFSISKLSCCVLYLLGYPIILEIHYILNVWLGGNVPDHTASFVVIVLLTQIINNLNAASSGVVHASGEMKKYQLSGSLFSLGCVIAAYFCLRIGLAPESVLWVTLVVSALAHFVGLLILRSIAPFSIKDYVVEIIIPFLFVVLVSFVAPLIVHLWMLESFIRFVVVLFVSMACILPAIYFVGMNRSERHLVKSFLISHIFQRNSVS